MIDKAKDALSTVSDRAGEQIETRLTDGKTRAADTVSNVAEALRTSSQQIRDNGQEDIGRYMDRAAAQVERVASYLNSADVREVAREVEDFGRRNPAALMAGAFVIGFAASRFLKASSGGSYATDDGIRTVDDLDRHVNYNGTDTPATGYGTASFDSSRMSVGLEGGDVGNR